MFAIKCVDFLPTFEGKLEILIQDHIFAIKCVNFLPTL
jgi:hypothetical protein